ncbi:MAG: hypothetical protein Tsb0027_13180 [Wenzhouxiangellaceae bacterium]
MLLSAAIIGVILYAASALLYHYTKDNQYITILCDFWKDITGSYESLIPSLALFLGFISGHSLNFIGMLLSKIRPGWNYLERNHAIDTVIKTKGEPLELFLRKALGNEFPIMITLTSGKVYVGRVIKLFNPTYDIKHIELLMEKSGYRNDVNQTVSLDTNYDEIYTEIVSAAERRLTNLTKNRVLGSLDKTNNEDQVRALIIEAYNEVVRQQDYNKKIIAEAKMEHQLVCILPINRVTIVHPYNDAIYSASIQNRKKSSRIGRYSRSSLASGRFNKN